MAVEAKAPDLTTARLPADLVTMAKTISAHCNETVGEIINAAARATVTRRYRQTVERLTRDIDEAGA